MSLLAGDYGVTIEVMHTTTTMASGEGSMNVPGLTHIRQVHSPEPSVCALLLNNNKKKIK